MKGMFRLFELVRKVPEDFDPQDYGLTLIPIPKMTNQEQDAAVVDLYRKTKERFGTNIPEIEPLLRLADAAIEATPDESAAR